MNIENDPISVFIVAASTIARAGLESVLQADEAFIVAGGAAEISAAAFDFPAGQTIDVFLINIEREKDFGDLLSALSDNPEDANPPVVALFPLEMQGSEHAAGALQSGVRGFLPTDAAADEITATVAAAANGLVSFLPETMENLFSFSAAVNESILEVENSGRNFAEEPVESLTARESEILEMLADGASNKAIAYRLDISEHTVKFHVASIFGKLGVNTRTEAVTRALRSGIILL